MKTGGRREREQISLPCLKPSLQRHSQQKREEGRDILPQAKNIFGRSTDILRTEQRNSPHGAQSSSHSVRLMRAFSPQASDWQSDGTD